MKNTMSQLWWHIRAHKSPLQDTTSNDVTLQESSRVLGRFLCHLPTSVIIKSSWRNTLTLHLLELGIVWGEEGENSLRFPVTVYVQLQVGQHGAETGQQQQRKEISSFVWPAERGGGYNCFIWEGNTAEPWMFSFSCMLYIINSTNTKALEFFNLQGAQWLDRNGAKVYIPSYSALAHNDQLK